MILELLITLANWTASNIRKRFSRNAINSFAPGISSFDALDSHFLTVLKSIFLHIKYTSNGPHTDGRSFNFFNQ